jgi:hypothetical protein
MQLASNSRKFSGALAAFALITSSTGAIAASTPTPHPSSISPLVALSALASDSSRVALCGAAAAAAAGASATQGANPGCVLPVVDPAAAPPPVADALPPPPVAPPPVAPLASEGFGISPLLLGLVAVAAAVGLYFLLKKKKTSSPD